MTTPADQSGYCVSTAHSFGARVNSSQTSQYAVSPDGLRLFVPHGASGINRIHLDTFTVDAAWATVTAVCVACDPAGNVYSIPTGGNDQVDKTDPSGTTTPAWALLPIFVGGGSTNACLGRDGNLYFAFFCTGDGFYHVVKVTLGGTVTDLTALIAQTGGEIYQGVAVTSAGVVGVTLVPDPTDPNYGVNNVLRVYDPAGPTVTDRAYQSLVDPTDDSPTEANGGIFCMSDDVFAVPLVTFQGTFTPGGPADLSWFLRVTPAGVATRIAGTWSYGSTPPPAATGTNIADGPLGTSLCCELDDGAGISQDGKTVWFIDDGDQNNGTTGNLLRKLALCGGMRWRTGAVVVC